MGEVNQQEAQLRATEELLGFLEAQLAELEDARNVHRVRERLFGDRWAETLDVEALPEGIFEPVAAEVDRAWNALTRYPWDLYGAQQALKTAVAIVRG
jgi:hypothetical protein